MAKKKKDAPADDDAAAAAAKKKKMMIGAVVLAAVAYKFVLAPSPAPEEEVLPEEGVALVIEEGDVVAIPELVINLADEAELRYLRVGIGVVLEVGFLEADIESKLPLINDVVVDVMSSKTLDDLRKPGAKQEAKDELSALVREAFDDTMVVRIIFTSFVMQ